MRARQLAATALLPVLALGAAPPAGAQGPPVATDDAGVAYVVDLGSGQRKVVVATRTGQVASELSLTVGRYVAIVNDLSGNRLDGGPGCGDTMGGSRVICRFDKGTDQTLREISVAMSGGDDLLVPRGIVPVFGADLGAGDDDYSGWIRTPSPDFGPEAADSPPVTETVTGGAGSDRLVVTGVRGSASGGAGTDRITVQGRGNLGRGEDGNDQVKVVGRDGRATGGAGDDVLSAQEAGDGVLLSGGAGKDKLFGSPFDDELRPGAGEDRVLGGAGKDLITSRDGRKDVVNCGGDADTVFADGSGVDATVLLCETVRRP